MAQLRHRLAAGKILPALVPGTSGASPAALTELERSALVLALQTLAPRQREALILTYYAGLPDAQIASAMRVSQGAVNSHDRSAMWPPRWPAGEPVAHPMHAA